MLLIVFIVLIFTYSLVSRPLEQTIITAPVVFTLVGMIAGFLAPESQQGGFSLDLFLRLAEIGLVLLLFTDASRTDLTVLRSIWNLPVRLLSTGLLLTIFLGAVAAQLLFPRLSIWEAGILAAILAPTDAGLGQIIVNSPHVPLRIRQALNVEAGLNDGLSVPFLLFFMALAASDFASHDASMTRFIVEQLGFGTLVGLGIGLVGGWLLGVSSRRNWITETFQQIGVVVLPVLCLVLSEAIGASMFISAFVAGLAVQLGFKEVSKHSVEFSEQWGQLINLSVFFIFGVLVARGWQQFTTASILYGVLSLTVIRMLPVAIALIGTGLSRATVLFTGWFGPRGLASIVLGLVYLEQETHLPGEPVIRVAVMSTVLLSIFAHGLSAMPGVDLYQRKIASLAPDAPEHAELK
ncbi:MAG TPA: cation:proton antiporter [Terriglobales bacterium]|nr:cation:proton antiporter [Terriglobales bacterium]